MDARRLLRTYAHQELRSRLLPPAHYLLRPHSHQADVDLVESLLKFPEHFELTPREHAAADALSTLANYELRSRDILSRAHPARDFDDPTPSPGVTEDEQQEMDGLREVMRRSALVFAQMIDAKVLAEAFQPPDLQGGDSRPAGSAHDDVAKQRLDALRKLGGDVKFHAGKWKITGMAALVRHEKGRQRSSEKTIRADLRDAAEAERRVGKGELPLVPWPAGR